MSRPPCGTCGGTRVAPYQDKPVPGAIGGEGAGVLVCTACSVIVSLDFLNAVDALMDALVAKFGSKSFDPANVKKATSVWNSSDPTMGRVFKKAVALRAVGLRSVAGAGLR